MSDYIMVIGIYACAHAYIYVCVQVQREREKEREMHIYKSVNVFTRVKESQILLLRHHSHFETRSLIGLELTE